MDYDALVIGSGIAGLEAAVKLGDMGYQVLVVEKEPSIGGKMIHLSKVFPTLDCASCIATPKMAATAHHPNVTVVTDGEVTRISRQPDGTFRTTVHREPRFVDETLCTGCRLCEQACTVAVPDQFNGELVARHAAYIPFPQAIPQKALIERAGTSPCSYGCPAGIKAHGYVSLVRAGEYEKAFGLVLETTPLAGSLGRACYAPCETECTRGSLEGPLPIRRLKRFVADRHYSRAGAPGSAEAAPPPPVPGSIRPNGPGFPATGKRVAIVGSGPAGLTAAWQLARAGHSVKIFEAAPVAGGAMRLSIPAYRLPAEVDPARRRGGRAGRGVPGAEEGAPVSERRRRIGVYVCRCGGNISDYVDVQRVVDAVSGEDDVVVAHQAMFTCSDATQAEIEADITGQHLDGLVVASCSPKLHELTFRGVAQRAGLNPYQYTQVNIREQCSWTHTDDPEGATGKAIGLVRAGIARTRLTGPLEPLPVRTTPRVLVVGGGVAGMRAAIGLAGIGLEVVLVERESRLGGQAGQLGETFPHGTDGRALAARLAGQVSQDPAITVFTGAEVTAKSGTFGNYRVTVTAGDRRHDVDAGQIIVATGGRQLPAGGRRIRLRHRRRAHAAGVPHPARPDGRAADLGRTAGTVRRLHLLRREQDRGPSVLLAVLLHRRGALLPAGSPARPCAARAGHPPVPPVPGPAHLRPERAAAHRVTGAWLGVPEVRR